MKQAVKNETILLELINKIQSQLLILDKKIDTLINRPLSEVKVLSKPAVNNSPASPKPNDHHNVRQMHKAICADCNKECTIPFKPSADRPVYCQDCFSRRKVMSMAGMKLDNKPKEIPAVPTSAHKPVEAPRSQDKGKKKTVAAKKSVGKKKTVPKKK